MKRVVILTRGLLGGCAMQACAVKDGSYGKTPLRWAVSPMWLSGGGLVVGRTTGAAGGINP